jgi:hypothetical protein
VYHLAQLNVAVMKAPLDSPPMADFTGNLDRINALAERSPGYVWRLKSDEGNATEYRPLGDDVLVNLSVWKDVASLSQYVYHTAHVEIMRRRREWFERMSAAYMVLWWVPAGHTPTVEQAIARLEHLRANGPSRTAFTFAQAYGPPDSSTASEPFRIDDACPA